MRSMTEEYAYWLQVGHTFPTKEMLLLRIAEEANLFGVRTTIIRSVRFQVMVIAINGEQDPFLVPWLSWLLRRSPTSPTKIWLVS